MAEPKLVKMGIRRKDLHPQETASPKSEKDYDKEEVRPELHLTGPHAEMMGAEDLKKGDRVRQVVEWVVKDRVKREVDGKPDEYELTLCIDRAGEHVECGKEKADDDKSEPGADSPAMQYIQGRAKEA